MSLALGTYICITSIHKCCVSVLVLVCVCKYVFMLHRECFIFKWAWMCLLFCANICRCVNVCARECSEWNGSSILIVQHRRAAAAAAQQREHRKTKTTTNATEKKHHIYINECIHCQRDKTSKHHHLFKMFFLSCAICVVFFISLSLQHEFQQMFSSDLLFCSFILYSSCITQRHHTHKTTQTHNKNYLPIYAYKYLCCMFVRMKYTDDDFFSCLLSLSLES